MSKPMAGPSEDVVEDQAETTTIPIALLGGAKAGGTVTLKVVSLDENEGVATVAPAAGGEDGGPEGSDELAASVGQPTEE